MERLSLVTFFKFYFLRNKNENGTPSDKTNKICKNRCRCTADDASRGKKRQKAEPRRSPKVADWRKEKEERKKGIGRVPLDTRPTLPLCAHTRIIGC